MWKSKKQQMAFKSYAKVLTWLALKNAAVYNYFKGEKPLPLKVNRFLALNFFAKK